MFVTSRRALLAGSICGGMLASVPFASATNAKPLILRRPSGVHILRGDQVTQVILAHLGVASVIRCPLGRLGTAAGFFTGMDSKQKIVFDEADGSIRLIG